MVGSIRVGIGGWTYAPWRGAFYPAGLPQSQELAFASRQLTAIEINGTYYRTQKPAAFARWRGETPDDFVFSLKASRYATNRRILAQAGDSIQRFVESGITELGPKLGPIVWQFAPTKGFDAADMEAFLALLPGRADGLALRHALDVRHASFATPAFLKLARKYKAAVVITDASHYPLIADAAVDFVYVRLMQARPRLRNGYAPKALQHWAQRARIWSAGRAAEDIAGIEGMPAARERKRGRDVFVYFINGAKERAPAAACALLKGLG